ncbi:hypothetical protein [Hyphococcus luteus]|uniref:Uncharacterized protein n=1 Tax=Hyphococcus luteus TaxID=2058213 RepID=A0A2S7K0M9_9PROT|nr:hypothetical protein [Marinicaulis flavus]PQA86026.1 hypothetical protein CW354_16735 [Marinicaulis flavus]
MSAKPRKKAEQGKPQKGRKARRLGPYGSVERLEASLENEGTQKKCSEFDISENNQYIDEQLKRIEQLEKEILNTKNKKKDDKTKKEILDGLSEIFESISVEDALKIYAVSLMMNQNPLPKRAPELYRDRKDRSEKAPDFIKRVYSDFIGKGLSKAHIRQLDRGLYQALYNWLKDNELPVDLPLPMKSEITDRRLAALSNIQIHDESGCVISAERIAREMANLQRAKSYRRK